MAICMENKNECCTEEGLICGQFIEKGKPPSWHCLPIPGSFEDQPQESDSDVSSDESIADSSDDDISDNSSCRRLGQTCGANLPKCCDGCHCKSETSNGTSNCQSLNSIGDDLM